MANFCPYCGSGLKAGATHCSSCGAGVCATNDAKTNTSDSVVGAVVGTLVAVTLAGGLTRQLYYHRGRYFIDPMCHNPFGGRIIGPHRPIHIHIGHHTSIGRMHPIGGGPRGPLGRPRPIGGPRGGGPRGGGHGPR